MLSMRQFAQISGSVALAAVVALIPTGSANATGMMSMGFEPWLDQQTAQSAERMLANITPNGTAPGVVVASPERVSPNYYYHWVRDAALTMNTVVQLYAVAQGSLRDSLRNRIVDYARFSRGNQTTLTIAGMGEPKFNVDGSAFMGSWCRPQNDGPALRALTLTHFANLLLDAGDGGFVHSDLYDGNIPTSTVIKADLEFVAHHWRETSCDIWEEVSGDHFYTKLVQRRAMIEGAALANRLGDPGAATFYLGEAGELNAKILEHWDSARAIFLPTLNWKGGIDYKTSGLDGQVILGILHSGGFAFSDARVQSTMRAIAGSFVALYPVNRVNGAPGVGIGRYPEDVYDGARFEGGNPWVLITAAFANGYYRAAAELAAQGRSVDAHAQFDLGDQYLKRIQYHANPDGSLSEQFDRNSGFMVSARDLTWSHVELIQAAWARAAASRRLKQR
jgi:glucoamylase